MLMRVAILVILLLYRFRVIHVKSKFENLMSRLSLDKYKPGRNKIRPKGVGRILFHYNAFSITVAVNPGFFSGLPEFGQ